MTAIRTGLGLSTVYGIVQQFGGSVVFHSELGKGTVFRVFLVMPRMSGADVVARIRELVPSVRVLLMSGYTEHPHVGQIVGGPGFIQKPFAPAMLATRVRELLDAEPTCQT